VHCVAAGEEELHEPGGDVPAGAGHAHLPPARRRSLRPVRGHGGHSFDDVTGSISKADATERPLYLRRRVRPWELVRGTEGLVAMVRGTEALFSCVCGQEYITLVLQTLAGISPLSTEPLMSNLSILKYLWPLIYVINI
jgi:hypothetical protein